MSFLTPINCRPNCPSVMERMKMCRRSDHTVEELKNLREKPVELDPNLMTEMENVIKGLEAHVLPSNSKLSSASKPRRPVVPSSPPSLPFTPSLSSIFLAHEYGGDDKKSVTSGAPAPSPYSLSPDTATSSNLLYIPSLPGMGGGRGFLSTGKTRKLINLLSHWIDEDDRYNRRASKTAKVIGHVAGNIVGMLVNDRFRRIGDAFGDLARTGVREITIASLDNVLKYYSW